MALLNAGQQKQRPHRRSADDEFLVAHPTTGKELEALINSERPDIILLDWTLPDAPLRELIDRLRTQPEAGEIPIAVLTFRGPQTQRICVFSTNGADGTVKSTEWPSLMARVQAALRSYADDEEACRIRIGDIEIDRPARKVRRGRRDVPLSPTEFQLLECAIPVACSHAARSWIVFGSQARTLKRAQSMRMSPVCAWRWSAAGNAIPSAPCAVLDIASRANEPSGRRHRA